MTSQRRLQFDRLTTPVLAKGVLPFSLPWIDSMARVRPGLPSLAFHPLREQTEENVSVGRDSAYRDCTFSSFPTRLGDLPLVHTSMNPHQRHKYWRQWWCQLDNPINLVPSHIPRVYFVGICCPLITDWIKSTRSQILFYCQIQNKYTEQNSKYYLEEYFNIA